MHLRRFVWMGALACGACGGGDAGRDDATAPTTVTPTTPATTGGEVPTTGGEVSTTGGVVTGEATSTGGGPTSATTAGPGETGPDETTGECAAQMLAPETKQVPVDIVVVVDTSDSMANAIAAVEASINVDFAQILTNSMIDYRIVVIGDYPPPEAQLAICIGMPLSGADCQNPPAVPAVTERYKHYDRLTGSGAFLDNILSWYTMPDIHGLAPGGYRDFLRDGARKVILAMTDGTSAAGDTGLGDAFDMSLLMLDPPHFGTPGNRDYVFHTIITMDPNDPPNAPWLAGDPIQGEGGSIQQVSVLTDGWRFPLSQTQDFDVLFQEIAKDVVEQTPIACDFPIPVPDMGLIDPDTVEIDYMPGDGSPLQSYHQVTGPDACEEDAFYIFNGTVFLCPQACAEVQADAMAQLDVRYGCDVGFVPG